MWESLLLEYNVAWPDWYKPFLIENVIFVVRPPEFKIRTPFTTFGKSQRL